MVFVVAQDHAHAQTHTMLIHRHIFSFLLRGPEVGVGCMVTFVCLHSPVAIIASGQLYIFILIASLYIYIYDRNVLKQLCASLEKVFSLMRLLAIVVA